MQFIQVFNNFDHTLEYRLATWFCLIYILAGCFAIPTGPRSIGISHFALIQKGGKVDRSCLYNLVIDNNMSDYHFTPADERLFLLDLYDATGGQYYWYKKTGWGENSTIHHCKWFGIQCYESSSYIKWINLIDNGLTGRLPIFWKIRNLQGLCLSINKQ
ncbi:Hypothetical predicted protein [Paramuricea clavata]|uniref:Uncharacterized protein n=1 Tax=Paramuricea clavata TaxID=317549 RepID=A0A7D9IJY9_PARCT|nr:Hypothetical predicted protein [Paramuricea clavata]